MRTTTEFDFAAYLKRRFGLGIIAIQSAADRRRYAAAVEDFATGADTTSLRRQLRAIGLSATQIRWHVANPGRQRVVAWC